MRPPQRRPIGWRLAAAAVAVCLALVATIYLHPVLRLGRLTSLDLAGTQVTDAGLETVGRLESLQDLTLSRLPTTDTGLRRLERLPQLRSLNAQETQVTDAGSQRLMELFPRR